MALATQSATTMASPSRPSSSSHAVRFLSFVDQPDADQNSTNHQHLHTLELDESDVVWSSSSAYSSDADSHSPPQSTNSPTTHLRRHRTHLNHPSNCGLSAALPDDHLPLLVRRKSTLNPSLSAASAARMVPPVVRSESPHLSPKSAGRYHQSAPVNVPVWPKDKKRGGGFGGNYLDQLEEVDEERELDEEEEMVPPHVIVARSHVTFSVFEGVGRTLKGRDLRSVRNAVFQKTGFLD